jgi:hypothetical protein
MLEISPIGARRRANPEDRLMDPASTGGERPARLEIGPDTIQVWFFALATTSERLGALAALLSEDERERAGRFLN